MTEVVVVGLAVSDPVHASALRRLDGHVAFLQLARPALVDVLTELADTGAERVVLVGFTASGQSLRSWLRRVASHWLREYDGPLPEVAMAVDVLTDADPEQLAAALTRTRPLTDDAPGLTNPAWEEVPGFRHQVFVCRGPRCAARGAGETAAALTSALIRHGLGDDDVLVTQTGCQFPCNHAPVVSVHPDDTWYGRMEAAETDRLVTGHLIAGGRLADRRIR
ncbi:(2Fe-2S) ferredoxin domain-containing protein [Nocardioides limicola]|uniref:(2Fe-2S) ferredoxin domain-containing protein n=1 Tax=Nocardioides limicola TaxID=2803368 RepID=UPI00193C8132|nr:(2Fe-2S) ferredoxin domain-containing protein [Nocardioides sp. DJM-14]